MVYLGKLKQITNLGRAMPSQFLLIKGPPLSKYVGCQNQFLKFIFSYLKHFLTIQKRKVGAKEICAIYWRDFTSQKQRKFNTSNIWSN